MMFQAQSAYFYVLRILGKKLGTIGKSPTLVSLLRRIYKSGYNTIYCFYDSIT
jgi:hypothetical protein